ncbi:hypothetical protein [Clostridioides difficile]|uniref:hypothetical protein n=1 Tax=Clostridioides difficile TaxID=1496 RepID=UPI00097FE3BC|nr:hypothetical protein [Clostridioides difficile]SJO45787.1 Uncharacterised protein [Clostridioides difficile]
MEQMAIYSYLLSKEKSGDLQKNAFKNNSQLLKSKSGISYSKVSFLNKNRLNRIRNYISKFNEFEEFILHLNEILDNFSFGMPEDKFEASLKEIGEMVGYKSQRQDQERI